MDSIFFVIKTLLFTFFIVLVMQFKWDDQTLEKKAYSFLTDSTIVRPIEGMADGAVVFIRNSWVKITRSLNSNFTNALRSENQPGSRQTGLGLERSKAYVKDTTDKMQRQWQAARPEVEYRVSKNIDEAKESTTSIVEKFKNKVSNVSQKMKRQIVDETDVPAETRAVQDPTSARSTSDDEMIDEE